jgi:hypothetical protein
MEIPVNARIAGFDSIIPWASAKLIQQAKNAFEKLEELLPRFYKQPLR